MAAHCGHVRSAQILLDAGCKVAPLALVSNAVLVMFTDDSKIFIRVINLLQYLSSLMPIVVKVEEINVKFRKVRYSSRCNNVRKSSRSTFNHNCYRNALGILNVIPTFSAQMLIGHHHRLAMSRRPQIM